MRTSVFRPTWESLFAYFGSILAIFLFSWIDSVAVWQISECQSATTSPGRALATFRNRLDTPEVLRIVWLALMPISSIVFWQFFCFHESISVAVWQISASQLHATTSPGRALALFRNRLDIPEVQCWLTLPQNCQCWGTVSGPGYSREYGHLMQLPHWFVESMWFRSDRWQFLSADFWWTSDAASGIVRRQQQGSPCGALSSGRTLPCLHCPYASCLIDNWLKWWDATAASMIERPRSAILDPLMHHPISAGCPWGKSYWQHRRGAVRPRDSPSCGDDLSCFPPYICYTCHIRGPPELRRNKLPTLWPNSHWVSKQWRCCFWWGYSCECPSSGAVPQPLAILDQCQLAVDPCPFETGGLKLAVCKQPFETGRLKPAVCNRRLKPTSCNRRVATARWNRQVATAGWKQRFASWNQRNWVAKTMIARK